MTENPFPTVVVQLANPAGFFVQSDRRADAAEIRREDQRRQSCDFRRYYLPSSVEKSCGLRRAAIGGCVGPIIDSRFAKGLR